MNGTVEKNRSRARRMSPVERKSQLLRAALKVSAEKGLGACYHRDLAEMTGVSVPTAFHYFPTSDDLVSSVIDEVTRFLIDFVQVHIVDVEEPGAIAVHDMLIAFADAIDESPDAIKIWLHWSAGIQEQYWKNYLAFCNEAFAAIAVLVERGIEDGSMHPDLDPECANKIIYNCANLIATARFAGGTKKEVRKIVNSLVDGYLNGYRKQ